MTTATSPEAIASALAQGFAYTRRVPVLRRPDEYGLAYEDVSFPSQDGTPLEGWFIPADSDKLVIANHPMPCNRYGYPGHLPAYATPFADFEVNFLPDCKNLHDAGYNVLAYDLRNHGRSGAANGGLVGIGLFEYRDVIGSVRYGRERMGIGTSRIALLSRCLGADSTIVAMSKHPEVFDGIPAFVAVQPVSLRALAETALAQVPGGIGLLEVELKNLTGFDLDELSPLNHAKDVTVPTLIAQVHHDSSTRPEDVQGIYDNLGAKDKKLHWIEGTTRRFDGYNYFAENPGQMVDWFTSHLA
ncbi:MULTISPECIES: S9 family peptidase [unclassified Amycolatopsis]|uniref:alpha/beta hydrolase family protein n=1 Tax=unclassified Amycolatopsis TaxID=2618356 RepID=UPI001EE96228|nr:lysophospholipase [Amycolatopsis sp. Poz14]MCG3751923.1 alpha/beta hydrolase [Amycolatopsis sp. Poz14]